MTDTDRQQQIVDAATRVFARHGYHKASIKAIARAAGIRSPALIYHYFDDKRALFNAVISRLAPFQGTPLADPALADAWLAQPPAVFLPRMLASLFTLGDDPDTMRLIRLFLSEAARDPQIAAVAGTFQQNALAFLRRYLQHQVALGHLKPHDENSVARMLVGTVLAHLLGTSVFPAVAAGFPRREAYAAAIVDTFLHGLAAAEE